MAQAIEAPNAKLQGVYEVVRFRSCIQTGNVTDPITGIPGFDENDLRNLVRTREQTNVMRATETFNGDGTGQHSAASMIIRNDANQPGNLTVRQYTTECDFTYAVNADGSFSVEFGECTSTKVKGYGSDEVKSTGARYGGQLAKGGQSFVCVDNEPNILTSTNSMPDDGAVFKRICHSVGFGVKTNATLLESEQPVCGTPFPFRFTP